MALSKTWWGMIPMLLLALLAAGCNDKNPGDGGNNGNDNETPLSIEISPENHQLAFGDSVDLQVTVKGTHADDAEIAWKASPDVGSFSDTSGKSVTWTAPDASETVTLTATATYEDDSASASATVKVGALAVNIETATTGVGFGDRVSLKAVVTGTGATHASYAWSASEGALDTTDVQEVEWTAPDDATTATITVSVEADGNQSDASIDMHVQDPACGDHENCEVIRTLEDLQAMQASRDLYYVLGNDIDANATAGGNDFVPVGHLVEPFSGTFDGQGHTIRGLYMERPDSRTTGIFGIIGANGVIQDVTIEEASAKGKGNAGILASVSSGTIERVVIENSSVQGDGNAGALVGTNTGTIRESEVNAEVEGGKSVGGFVGENSGTMSDLLGVVTVSGDAWVGGVAGLNAQTNADGGDSDTPSLIERVHVTINDIFSGESAGGIVGYNGQHGSDSDPNIHMRYGKISHARVDLQGPIAIEKGGAGGIVGVHAKGSIDHASVYAHALNAMVKTLNTSNADARTHMGGLTGLNYDDVSASFVLTDNAFFIGDERNSSQDSIGGGLIGSLSGGMIANSYAHLRTNPQTSISGGGVGKLIAGSNTGMTYCYVEQSFQAVLNNVDTVGGLVAESSQPDAVAFSYWNKQTSELDDSAGGTPLVNAQMNSPSSYSTWDF